MSALFDELLHELETGDPIDEGGWSFIPLTTKRPSSVDYLTLFEAVESGLALVSEIHQQGSVPDLKVVNDGAVSLLIPDGMTLVGCKQNRVVNISLLVPPRSVTVIPVSCVERGRWHTESATLSPSEFCDPLLRSKMCKQSTQSFQETGRARANQSSVWEHVHDILGATCASSPTVAYHAAYGAIPETADEHELFCPPNANGIAVLRAGRICSLDLFDKPETLHKLWPRIRRGTRLSAQPQFGSPGPLESPRQFLADCFAKPQGEFMPVGLGTHHRFGTDGPVASALVADGQIVHLSAFHKDGATPTKPAQMPPTQPLRQSWWRRIWGQCSRRTGW